MHYLLRPWHLYLFQELKSFIEPLTLFHFRVMYLNGFHYLASNSEYRIKGCEGILEYDGYLSAPELSEVAAVKGKHITVIVDYPAPCYVPFLAVYKTEYGMSERGLSAS